MNKTFLKLTLGLLMLGFSSGISAQSPRWNEIASGVWKTTIGTPDKLDLFNTAGIKPVIEAGRTHAPVPFYVSDRGYGIFINSSRYLTVYAGTAVRKESPEAPESRDRNTDKKWTSQPYSDAVEILVPANGVEVYVFAGPTALDAVRRLKFCHIQVPILYGEVLCRI